MTNHFEQHFLINCALRLAAYFPSRSIVASELSEWVERTDLGFDWSPEVDRSRRFGVSEETWTALRIALDEATGRIESPAPDRLHSNTCLLAEYVGLDALEIQIFTLAVRAISGSPLGNLISNLESEAHLPIDQTIAGLTGVPPRFVMRALGRDSSLMQSGLVALARGNLGSGLEIIISDRLLHALDMATDGVVGIVERLFDDPGLPDVQWEDFVHLDPAADFAARVLIGAMREGKRGVNLLFYGPPGTGKTEFCKVLSARVGAQLHAVGEFDNSGEAPSRLERIQQLRLGQQLLSGRNDSVVLFDEMEDLLSSLASSPANIPLFALGEPNANLSKVHMNRLLETNPVPTLWTCNDIDGFDPALLRRLTFTIEMRTPAENVRARVWHRLAGNEGLTLDKATCAKLARDLPEPPALVANALRAVSLAGGGVEDLTLVVRAIGKATSGGHERAPISIADAPNFAPALINADTDILRLGERLMQKDAGRMVSFCLSGPPGSGKSAYARYLAREMGLPVIQKRASDILSKWVGGSEKNIADAFNEARAENAFLIFDEADSLLSSREMANHSWEVSQVNEMLTWMESHPLPFACTTNLAQRIDPASLRRFTFKITLKPLSREQQGLAFARFFKMEAPRGLEVFDNLTPGDFAIVARRASALGITDGDGFLAELAKEARTKPGGHRQFGFRLPQRRGRVLQSGDEREKQRDMTRLKT